MKFLKNFFGKKDFKDAKEQAIAIFLTNFNETYHWEKRNLGVGSNGKEITAFAPIKSVDIENDVGQIYIPFHEAKKLAMENIFALNQEKGFIIIKS